MSTLLERITISFFTIPSFQDWLWAMGLLLSYAAIAIPVGRQLGFLYPKTISSWRIARKTIVVAFFMPGLLEELCWRVAFIPHPTEVVSPSVRFFWIVLSLVLFVLYHPLNIFVSHDTFKDPVFLGLAALLGLACTIAYLATGSIWIPAIVHWLIVVGWLLFLGGHQKIKPSQFKIQRI
jgi:predicted Abi (CAAX) family protease